VSNKTLLVLIAIAIVAEIVAWIFADRGGTTDEQD